MMSSEANLLRERVLDLLVKADREAGKLVNELHHSGDQHRATKVLEFQETINGIEGDLNLL
jgi:hypothetical protein